LDIYSKQKAIDSDYQMLGNNSMIQVQQNLLVDSAKNILVLVYRDDEKEKLSEEPV
jgi:hypothetical protein